MKSIEQLAVDIYEAMDFCDSKQQLLTYIENVLEEISHPQGVEAGDMDAKEFFSNLFNLDFMTTEEQETIFKGAELFAQGKVRMASLPVPAAVGEEKK